MRKTSLIIASFLTFLASRQASAAQLMTWEECVAEAQRANPDLAAARERVRQAEANRSAAYAPFLPDVSLDAGYSRSGTEVGGSSSTFRKDESYSYGASARQNLFAGGRDAATLRRRSADLNQARAALDATRAAVSFDVKTAFTRLLFAQQQLVLTKEIDRRRAENVRLVGLRYEAGREHKGSFLRSRANASQSAFEVAQASRTVRVAQRALLRAIGRSEFDTILATGTLRAVAPSGLPDFRRLAEETPAFRQAVADTIGSRADLSSARGNFLPDLSASGSAGRRGGEWPPATDSWSVGLSVSYPLFQGGQNFFNLRAAKAAYRESTDGLRSVGNDTALALESSYASLEDAVGRSIVQDELLEAGTVRAQIARGQYTSGLLTFDDWDVIENDLINVQKSRLAALRDAALAEADWEQAQGKGAVQ